MFAACLKMLSIGPAAPCRFYPALARSTVSAPPVLRCPSLNCDQTKNYTKRPKQQSPSRLIAVVLSGSLVAARGSCSPDRPKPGHRSCGGCADRLVVGHSKGHT